MNFKPELAEAVMTGSKTVTRRVMSGNPRSPYHLNRAPLLVDKRIAICPGRGKVAIGTARVVAVRLDEGFDPFWISPSEAVAEGLVTVAAFVRTWTTLHGSLDPLDVWRIELADPQRGGDE